jgi:hypothetical protein
MEFLRAGAFPLRLPSRIAFDLCPRSERRGPDRLSGLTSIGFFPQSTASASEKLLQSCGWRATRELNALVTGQPRLGQVEVALDATKRFVVDRL